MTDENGKFITSLDDARELKERKQKELEYYLDHLKELQIKISWLEADLKLTNTIIKIIENESILPLDKHPDKEL